MKRAAKCARCGHKAPFKNGDPGATGIYECPSCGWWTPEDHPDLVLADDGRIRVPADFTVRLDGIRAASAADPAFQQKNRDVLRWVMEWYIDKAEAENWVQILAADTWVAAQLTAKHKRPVARQHVWRQRHALEDLGYVRTLKPSQVTRRDLKRVIAEYKVMSRKPPTVIEILKQLPPAV